MNMKKTKCTCSCPVKVQSMYKHKKKIQTHKLQDVIIDGPNDPIV